MPVENRDHFLVGDLGEVPVPLAHPVKQGRGNQADDIVGLPCRRESESGAQTGIARIGPPGPWRRTARSAAVSVTPVATPSSTTITVRPASGNAAALAAVSGNAAAQLGPLARDDRFQRPLPMSSAPAPRDRRPGCHPRRSRRSRTRDCGARRLAHGEKLQRGSQRRRNLSGNRDAAAGQAHDDRGPRPPSRAAGAESWRPASRRSVKRECLAREHRKHSRKSTTRHGFDTPPRRVPIAAVFLEQARREGLGLGRGGQAEGPRPKRSSLERRIEYGL